MPADEASIAEMHQGWMESPGHRVNILAQGIAYYGFGLAESEQGTRYGVQVFSGPGVPRDLDDGAVATILETEEQAQLAVEIINEAREEHDVVPIAQDNRLVDSAHRVVMDLDSDGTDPGQQLDIVSALPDDIPWRQFQLVMGNCTGCGTRPTDQDVRFFVSQWLQDQTYRTYILDESLSHIGFVVEADGQGRKTALAILGG